MLDQPTRSVTARPATRGPGPSPDGEADETPEPGRPARWRLGVDAAVLFGLSGVAVTQPLLDLFGRNPTFFVAGHYGTGQIVCFAVLVAVVPAAVVLVPSVLARLLHPRLAWVLHGLGVAALAALFGLVLCRTLHLDAAALVVPVAVALGAAVAVAERRSRLARQFLAYLAVGNVAFVVLFLTSSPTADLLAGDTVAGQQGTVVVPPLEGPVVLVIFDELPVTSIMHSDGTINDARYPNLARLAERSTWFRNAASESRSTVASAPSILSGVRGDRARLPILDEYPRNYLSLFGDRHPVNRYELVTDMCPADVCEPPPAPPLRQLLDDASLVYGHRVLPSELRAGLLPVDTAWGDFGSYGAEPAGADTSPSPSTSPTTEPDPFAKARGIAHEANGTAGQAEVFRHHVGLIDASPSVNLIHVLLPHHPYRLTPWGDGQLPATRLPDTKGTGEERLPEPGDPAHDFRYRQLYALQAMQIGAVDKLVGEMIDHLESTGAWDDALVVVTSDHGIDTTGPGFSRYEDGSNTDELFRIPLFIKAPGQAEGAVDDAPASTVDVLPSIVDLLDVETDWEFDGHSLFDGSDPTFDRHVRTDVDAAMRVAAAHEARFPRGDDWVALAAVGEGEDLVGTPVSDHRVGEPSSLGWRPDHGDVLEELSVAQDGVPYILEGTVEGGGGRPPELVVAINGRLAGTIGGYLPAGERWRFTGHVAPYFRDGRNDATAYEVDRSVDGVVLHPVQEL